jgi:MFS family permease
MILAYLAAAPNLVQLDPSLNSLPGGGTLQTLVNGLGAWALIAALVGLVIGAAAWALGVHSQNFQQSMVGRRAVLVSGLAALLIGAAPQVVNFFWNQGANLH